MRHGLLRALVFVFIAQTSPRAEAATASDPFTIDRSGAEQRAAASRPLMFRIEIADERVTCGRWRITTLVRSTLGEPPWRRVRSVEAVTGIDVAVYGLPGSMTLVVVDCPGHPGYSLHGPRVWKTRDDVVQVVQIRRRRTVRVIGTHGLVRMALSQQYGDDRWPECHQRLPGVAECIGVPYEAIGVAVSDEGTGLRWALAEAEATTMQLVTSVAARWGRLLYLVDVADRVGDRLQVGAWLETSGPGRASSLRARFVPDARTDVQWLGPRSMWVAGRDETDRRFVEIKGAHTTTIRLGADSLIAAPADQPFRVLLRPPIPVAGTVIGASGAAAGGALVSVFELLEDEFPTDSDRRDEIAVRRWIAETTADAGGRFAVSGPPPGRYEFVVVHATLGRTAEMHQVDGSPLTLQLRAMPRMRGRVLRDHQPLAGVAVRSVPDAAAFAGAADPIALLAPGSVTNQRGEFELSLPGQGSGDLLIGGLGTSTVRRRYTDAARLPPVTNLGDIELPGKLALTVRLPGGSCELFAAGPLGSLGVGRVGSTFDRQARAYRFRLPETGFWWLEAICDGEPKAVVPPVVRVDARSSGGVVDAAFGPAMTSSR